MEENKGVTIELVHCKIINMILASIITFKQEMCISLHENDERNLQHIQIIMNIFTLVADIPFEVTIPKHLPSKDPGNPK